MSTSIRPVDRLGVDAIYARFVAFIAHDMDLANTLKLYEGSERRPTHCEEPNAYLLVSAVIACCRVGPW